MKTAFQTISLLITVLATLALSSCATSPASSSTVKPYPLDTCMVIGAKLNSKPKTYTRIHNNQEVKFCCKSCIKAFNSNPEFFLAKIK